MSSGLFSHRIFEKREKFPQAHYYQYASFLVTCLLVCFKGVQEITCLVSKVCSVIQVTRTTDFGYSIFLDTLRVGIVSYSLTLFYMGGQIDPHCQLLYVNCCWMPQMGWFLVTLFLAILENSWGGHFWNLSQKWIFSKFLKNQKL